MAAPFVLLGALLLASAGVAARTPAGGGAGRVRGGRVHGVRAVPDALTGNLRVFPEGARVLRRAHP